MTRQLELGITLVIIVAHEIKGFLSFREKLTIKIENNTDRKKVQLVFNNDYEENRPSLPIIGLLDKEGIQQDDVAINFGKNGLNITQPLSIVYHFLKGLCRGVSKLSVLILSFH